MKDETGENGALLPGFILHPSSLILPRGAARLHRRSKMATRDLHPRFTLRMFIPAAVALALCAASGPVSAAPPKRPKVRQNAQADRLMPDLYAAAMRGDPDGVKA